MAPKRLGGRSFDSRVRGVKFPEVKERAGKRERAIKKQLERYGRALAVEDNDEEKGAGSSICFGRLIHQTRHVQTLNFDVTKTPKRYPENVCLLNRELIVRCLYPRRAIVFFIAARFRALWFVLPKLWPSP